MRHHGRAWLQDFFSWHNDDHHHTSLALFTPADVFHGRVEVVRAARQSALDEAYRVHPERFTHGAPRVAMPPTAVHINPLVSEVLSILPETSDDMPSTTAGPRALRAARLRGEPRMASVAT